MTNHIFSTDDYSTLNASVRYDDANGSYPYFDMNYGSTEAYNTTLNETWVLNFKPGTSAELIPLAKLDS